MDASKTGSFIAELRKSKGYTQKTLAERLDVSDKAISRWETGKGFPDTSLLKPLSDELGISVSELLAGERIPEETIKEKTDHVIVTSMTDSKKELSKMKILCSVLAILVILCLVITLIPMVTQPSAIEFVNNGSTYAYYALAKGDQGICYNDMIRKDFDGGFEYYTPDGTQRYVFTTIHGGSEPVLSYMHHSGDGMLFGFPIGADTVIKGNDDLGVESASLVNFLKENGFHAVHEDLGFGRPTLVYINGERCNWFTYTKENVFISICISAYEGNRLMGYDIGLIDDSTGKIFEEMLSGFPLVLEDPYDLVTSEVKSAYPQWESITITVADEIPGEALYLYINGKFAEKFTNQVTIQMQGAPMTVLITADKPDKE